MRILNLAQTAMAGAPVHLSICLNKYCPEIESRTVLRRRFTSENINNLQWDYDYFAPDTNVLQELIDWADIIHYHNKPEYGGVYFQGKPDVIQFHSQPEHHPNRYQPNITYSNFNGRKLVIAQYHPRYYTDAEVVPNMIDIWDDIYTKPKLPNSKPRIFFGYASEVKGGSGWAYKGVAEITEILNKFKDRCDVDIITNTPYNDMLSIKKQADIVVGDCSTGSYHLSELEGAAFGAVVMNYMDAITHENMMKISNTVSLPFEKTHLCTLEESLGKLIMNPEYLKFKGDHARRWMENHWAPRKLVNNFYTIYKRICNA
jgi:hypothetical protein